MGPLREVVLAAAVVVLCAAACGNKDDGAGDQAGKAESPKAESPKAAAKAPAPTAASDEAPAALDPEAWCAAVFGADVVGPLVGVEGLAYDPPRGRLPSGMAECKLEKSDPRTKIPQAGATVMMDCRGLSLDVAKHKAMYRQLAKDSYRDIDLGKGGAYAKVVAAGMTIHQLTYVHATAPCSLTVTTAHIDVDHIEALARVVDAKVTAGHYPRK